MSCIKNNEKGRVQMAQFFNFKEDYFGLNDKDIQRNTELYGLNIYTKKEKENSAFYTIK